MSGNVPQDPPPPAIRRLRVYAFDPLSSTRADLAGLNEITIELPWEQPWEDAMAPGPVNEYLEVIDLDASSGMLYHPVDLNHRYVLADQGLEPSEANPQFHQQMVFAVAMKTIRIFERALGRRILWSPRRGGDGYVDVQRLRIHPHAMEERNAYYSPKRKALLFGYFRSMAGPASITPKDQWIFTALSHDVIVHETTHAILDGMHRRFAEASSIDSAAFHEGFADLIAVFSRLINPTLVSHVLAQTGGRLDQPSILTGLARQYGEASGDGGALRECIEWDASVGRPVAATELLQSLERSADPTKPHLRGAVLVCAVYDAFCQIYHRKAADLFALAERMGQSRPDPVILSRMTSEATAAAEQVLNVVIRALDYLPPFDVRFGEFLRALVTADMDLVPHDPFYYRQSFIDAFRRRGIVPDGCLSLAPESLRWEPPYVANINARELVLQAGNGGLSLETFFERNRVIQQAHENGEKVWSWLMQPESSADDAAWEEALGIYFLPARDGKPTGAPSTLSRAMFNLPAVEVHAVRLSRRRGPDGQDLRQLVVQVTQRRRGYLDETRQQQEDAKPWDQVPDADAVPDFWFRGGATILIDLREADGGRITSIVRKRVNDDRRLARQRQFLLGRSGPGDLGFMQRDASGWSFRDRAGRREEPFALSHRG